MYRTSKRTTKDEEDDSDGIPVGPKTKKPSVGPRNLKKAKKLPDEEDDDNDDDDADIPLGRARAFSTATTTSRIGIPWAWCKSYVTLPSAHLQHCGHLYQVLRV